MKRAKQQRHAVPCPTCRSRRSEVRRTIGAGDAVKRLRHCADCGREWLTREGNLGESATGIETLLRQAEMSTQFTPIVRQNGSEDQKP